jgi:hypothetical protein
VSGATAAPSPPPSLNFAGLGADFSGPDGRYSVNTLPPDPNGAVGPNHYVEVVNTALAVFDKRGAVLIGPVDLNVLWTGFGGLCESDNDGDPIVRYDRMADRWIILEFAVSGADGASAPFLTCMVVSTTGDPIGTYNRYSFGYAGFPDYPKLSIWPDGYYLTVYLFAPGLTRFLGTEVLVFDRNAMLAGRPAASQTFQTTPGGGGVLASDLDSSRLPPPGSPNYLVGLGETANTLSVFRLHVDFARPAESLLSGPIVRATRPFVDACNDGACIPQAGTTQRLDSLADRVMFRLGYRAFADHESLVVAHSVTAGLSTGIRWYELRISSGWPAIYQQGTYAPDSLFRWMPSAAMDGSGDIAIGFSVSGPSRHPGIHYASRRPTDPLGTLGIRDVAIVDGRGSQTGQNRWGDYSEMSVDPADDCTFWYVNEYVPTSGSFNWSTRVGAFKFPNCQRRD